MLYPKPVQYQTFLEIEHATMIITIETKALHTITTRNYSFIIQHKQMNKIKCSNKTHD